MIAIATAALASIAVLAVTGLLSIGVQLRAVEEDRFR